MSSSGANLGGMYQLASAVNQTGVITPGTANGGLGAQNIIPGTSIMVPATNGRIVVIEFSATMQQTVAGDGSVLLELVETTGVATFLAFNYFRLPNSIDPAENLATIGSRFSVGPVVTPRSFQLRFQVTAPATSAPTVNMLNSAASPTIIRAVG